MKKIGDNLEKDVDTDEEEKANDKKLKDKSYFEEQEDIKKRSGFNFSKKKLLSFYIFN